MIPLLRITVENVESYLSKLHAKRVKVTALGQLGETVKSKKTVLKGFGYGKPFLVEYRLGRRSVRAVIRTMKAGPFGHEFRWDRAHSLLMAHGTYNKLPKHPRCYDVAVFTRSDGMKSLGDYDEFFILTAMAHGTEYFRDLERIRDSGELTELDRNRCDALADYITHIHRRKVSRPELYVRRVRDLIGHGEGIMGLIDSYPEKSDYISADQMEQIEKQCISWRWKLRAFSHRLSCVHGDYHPFNVLFRSGTTFNVLDRSRGEWGEPADDVSSMAINYPFFALQRYEEPRGPLIELFERFFDRYLTATGDTEMLRTIQPFYVWRALVVASPIWYPNLSLKVRNALFNFIRNVLQTEQFEPKRLGDYFSQ